MATLNISFRQAPNRMSFEAEEGGHFRASAGCSKWVRERCCRCRAISFFCAKQCVAAGFVLLVFQPLLMEAADSSNPLDPVPERSSVSPLNTRHRWREILGSFKATSGKSKVATPQQEGSLSHPLEITQATTPGVPHNGYPKRCQAGWDSSSVRTKSEEPEVMVSSAGNDEKESSHVKTGRLFRVASNLIRRASARAHSSDRSVPFRRDKAPSRTQSFFNRKSAFVLPSPVQRREGKSDVSGGEFGLDVVSTDGSAPGRGSVTTRSARRLQYRRNAVSLTDSSIFDQVRQEGRILSKRQQENRGSSTRLLDTGSSSNSTSSLPMLTGLTQRSATTDDDPPEADSAVESAEDIHSSASSIEKNSRAAPTENEEGATQESQTQHSEPQSPTTQEKDRQPWYLTIRLDTGAVSFSKNENATEPSVPHIKVVLLRESDVRTSSNDALLPLKLRLPQKSYICFTLNTLPLLLENADVQETEAILYALGRTKKHLLSSAMRLSDATDKPFDPNAIWCVVLDGDGGPGGAPYSTYVLLSDEEVEQG